MSQTIDQIFLNHAETRGDELALTDCASSHRLGLSAIDEISYSTAAEYIRHNASFFRQLGFREGDIILVQMPNIAETPLLLLALINAGLVPCLLPSHWRGKELADALEKVTPRAIIAHKCSADHDPFPTLFELAADYIGLRFIFGIGSDLPDGVTPLPEISDLIEGRLTAEEGQQKALLRRSGEQAALIGWTRDREAAPQPVAYTHLQLMANAHLIISAAGVPGRPSILTTYAPTNPIGLIGAFIPWIVEGGVIHLSASLKHALNPERFKNHKINLALVPESLHHQLLSAAKAAGLEHTAEPLAAEPHYLLVARAPHDNPPEAAGGNGPGAATSLIDLNGLCLLPRNQSLSAKGALLPLGPLPGPDGERVDPPFIEARLQGATQKAGSDGDVLSGRLELNGTAIAFADWQPDMTTTRHMNFNPHWEQTGLTAAITDQAMSLIRIEPSSGTVYYGSNPLNSAELDRLYQACPGIIDAAAFTIRDELLGERLLAAIIPQPGAALSYEEFKAHLLTQNISPAKIPEKLVTVEEIPRTEDGLVARREILSHP